jgi:hypothetical protein
VSGQHISPRIKALQTLKKPAPHNTKTFTGHVRLRKGEASFDVPTHHTSLHLYNVACGASSALSA